MSEENIKLTAIFRTDIRNPFSNLVFRPAIGDQFVKNTFSERSFTKDSILRMFRNISHGKYMYMAVASEEIQVMHSLQKLFLERKTIDEMELIAESFSEFEYKFDIPLEKQLNRQTGKIFAILKAYEIQIRRITPTKSFEGTLVYYLMLKLRTGPAII